MPDWARLNASRPVAPPVNAFDVPGSFNADDLRIREHGNDRRLLDTPDEVSGHAFGEAVGPHKQMNVFRCAGEENRGLPGGIPASYHNHLIAAADLRFHEGRRVIDAQSLVLLQVFDGKLP